MLTPSMREIYLETDRILDELDEKDSAVSLAAGIIGRDPLHPHTVASALIMRHELGLPISADMIRDFYLAESHIPSVGPEPNLVGISFDPDDY